MINTHDVLQDSFTINYMSFMIGFDCSVHRCSPGLASGRWTFPWEGCWCLLGLL